jgi:hypothetical protein
MVFDLHINKIFMFYLILAQITYHKLLLKNHIEKIFFVTIFIINNLFQELKLKGVSFDIKIINTFQFLGE